MNTPSPHAAAASRPVAACRAAGSGRGRGRRCRLPSRRRRTPVAASPPTAARRATGSGRGEIAAASASSPATPARRCRLHLPSRRRRTPLLPPLPPPHAGRPDLVEGRPDPAKDPPDPPPHHAPPVGTPPFRRGVEGEGKEPAAAAHWLRDPAAATLPPPSAARERGEGDRETREREGEIEKPGEGVDKDDRYIVAGRVRCAFVSARLGSARSIGSKAIGAGFF